MTLQVSNNYGARPQPPPSQASSNYLTVISPSQSLYPVLSEYMGLDLYDLKKNNVAIPAVVSFLLNGFALLPLNPLTSYNKIIIEDKKMLSRSILS